MVLLTSWHRTTSYRHLQAEGTAMPSSAYHMRGLWLWVLWVLLSTDLMKSLRQQQLRLALALLSETMLCIGQGLVLACLMIWELIMFHNFGANWCHRHWFVICRRSVVNLLEDWDYVCCSPFYKDYGLQTDLLLPSRVELVPRQVQWPCGPWLHSGCQCRAWHHMKMVPDLVCLRHSLHWIHRQPAVILFYHLT